MSAVPTSLAGLEWKHSIRNHITFEQAILDVCQVIKAIPQFADLKMDTELTLYVCRYIETIIKKEFKIDKKVLVIKCFTEIFDLTPLEQVSISRQIDFLWNNKKIRPSSVVKKVSRGVGAWLAKKLL